jgi:glucose uptake protein GlcU
MKLDKWVFLGIVAAIFNPLPTGVIAGIILLREKKYKNEGIVVFVLSIILLVLTAYLALYAPFGLINV